MKQFLFLICFLKVTFVHANILFLGDFSLGESYQKKLELKKKTNYLKKFGPDHFFTHLGDFLKKSNQTVVNFESVITNEKKSPFEIYKNWLHYDRPNKIVKVLKKYNLQYLSLERD